MSTLRLEAPVPVLILRWTARIFSLMALVVWGGFFIEHLAQWFVRQGSWPPARMTLLTIAHLALLGGLVLAWKRELAGGVLILAAGSVFFGSVAGREFPIFFSTIAVPAVLFLYCWWRTRRS